MQHFGDITKLHGSMLPSVDIITGGSPCQDLSTAGKRAGLAGDRSGLFLEQIRVIKEMRNEFIRTHEGADSDRRNIKPRYMVWENVQGAFSSGTPIGADFFTVLERTARVVDENICLPRYEGRWPNAGCILGDGWSIAWRLHDAQYWGVPQRRKRVALVADFGGQSAPEILFERDGVSGDINEGEEVGQTTAASTRENPAPANPVVAYRKTAHPNGKDEGQGWEETVVSDTLNTSDNTESRTPNIVVGYDLYNFSESGSVARTLSTGADFGHIPVIVGYDRYNFVETGNISRTLTTSTDGIPAVIDSAKAIVRMLTPLECARLQGFPDGWLDIGDWVDSKGKKHKVSDSAKYKALGNSIALPFWQWMASQIVKVLRREGVESPTMASLFDGIGGFPLVYSRCGCKPVWASEIEEFPIAVTKYHFPEDTN